LGDDRNTPQKRVWRARIVSMRAEGAGVTAVAWALGKTEETAHRWRERYSERGIEWVA
jgi:transposase